jgi:hypothetical protein
MKNKKLSLRELTINSFVTSINKKQKDTFNGGVGVGTEDPVACAVTNDPVICALSQIKHICLTIEITETAESIASIIGSIVRSNANTECAGATHLNCNDTFSPCKV